MKLAQFKTKDCNAQQVGILAGGRLCGLARIAQAVEAAGKPVAAWLLAAESVADFIRHGDAAQAEARGLLQAASELAPGAQVCAGFDPETVEFLPPVWPGKILAIGLNYRDHAAEGGQKVPSEPIIFTKLANTLTAHNAPIVLPFISKQIDYETELAVVIGRRAKQVSEAEAMEFVFGYAPINDVSARDLQINDGQWIRGKGLDTFAPLGPFITTRDEVPDPHNLKIEGRLNGKVMQSSNTRNLIFGVPYLISYISQGITLEPGDVIATGTPPGIGMFKQPPVFLRSGDVFEITIEGLGTLRNPVQDGPSRNHLSQRSLQSEPEPA